MKKIYSFVLMACALLLCTNVSAVTRTAGTEAEFNAAWQAAENGDVIKLTNDVTVKKTLWLGTANMYDAAKSITLNLNGWSLSNHENDLAYMFVITHGELNITGNGYIIQDGSRAEETFRLTGSTYNTVNPKTATSGYYSHLTIGEFVQINAQKNGIVIDEIDNMTFYPTIYSSKYYLHADHALVTAGQTAVSTKPYSTEVFDGTRGIANGVRIDVYGKIVAGKYAMKTNGNLGGPSNTVKANLAGYYSYYNSDMDNAPYSTFSVDHAPFVYIYHSADLRVPASSSGDKQPVSVYCSGYARWRIEGTCVGASGVYVKSGEVDIHDANIQSNATTYTAASATQSGVTGSGSALVIESSKVYAGYIDVDISGDSQLSATSGYAIDESITYGEEYQEGESKVNTITISGGSFDGGTAGVMTVCPQTAAEAVSTTDETTITIIGAQTDGGAVTIGTEPLEDYLSQQPNSTHIVWVDNGDNTQTMVISQGDPATPLTTWANIEALSSKTDPVDVKWDAIEEEKIMSSNTIYLGELQMLKGTAGNLQELTIPSDGTLQVKNLIMNSYARIVVEAGGKLIVTGEQGIVAPNKENIVLKYNSTTGAFASLLFDPTAVASNKHPNATVEFTSQSWRTDSDNLQWEWFGIPTYTAITSITATCPAFVAAFENSAWSNVGLVADINNDVNKKAKMNKPFAAYDLLANRLRTADAPKITISGEMVGNVNAVLNVNLHWTPVANSYTAEIDAETLVNALKQSANITDAIYVAAHNATTGKITWETVPDDELAGMKLKPMQAFLLNNPNYVEDLTINYASMVYAPATASAAPRRSAANEYAAKVTINVANEDGDWDNVDLRENGNVKSYEKYLNDDINIYVLDGEKNDYVYAENLENTYVGFSTVEGGNFTISFTKAEGREFDLIDLETGARVAVSEGETYSFTAAANTVADYRFKLVERQNAPTAIENTEAVKNVKGIYTITGQYLGEMNVWNTLPAGVYVVNGAKCVK